MTYPRYPAYKELGFEWLGEIPAHWEVKHLKRLARLSYGDSLAADSREEGQIPVYGSNGPVGTHSRANTSAPAIIIGRKGSFGKVNFATAPCFAIDTTFFIDSRTSKADLRWLYYVLPLLALDVQSQDIAVPGLSRESVYEHQIPVPTIPEQQAIAAFLDQETARIDTLIAKQGQMIALLQEKRKTVISHAVTRGLDPDVPLKDSGVEWLGMVPEHWEVKRLKFVADVRSGVAKGRDLGDRDVIEVPYLRVANVQDGYLDLSDVAMIEIARDEAERYLLQPGDVLMNEGGDFDKLGRGYVWQGEIERCIHQNHVFAVRPQQREDAFWINLATQASYAKHYFMLKSKQTTNLASISSTNIREWPVVMPPAHERRAILAELERQTSQVDMLLTRVGEGVELLKEHRTSLISAAVAGKIDVRGLFDGEKEAA